MKRAIFFLISALAHLLFLGWLLQVHFPVRVIPEPVRPLPAPSTTETVLIAPRIGWGSIGPLRAGPVSSAASPAGSRKSPRLIGAHFVAEAVTAPSKNYEGNNHLALPMALPGQGRDLNLKKYLATSNPEWRQWPLAGKGDRKGIAPEISGALLRTEELISPELRTWASQVVRIVNQNWVIPVEAVLYARTRVVVKLVVGRNGDILETRLVDSTTPESLSRSALAAVSLARGLPPLPRGFSSDRVETQLVFHYGV